MVAPLALAAIPSVIGAVSNIFGARSQNKAQIQSAREQMQFQERMSSTAHQREVADLRAAGLNPILSATGGAGSSTPSGAQANIVNEMSGATSSALAYRELVANIKNRQMEYEVLRSQAEKNTTEAENLRLNRSVISGTARNLGITGDQGAEVLKGMRIEGSIDETKLGEITRYLNRIFGAGGSAQGVMRLLPGGGVFRR